MNINLKKEEFYKVLIHHRILIDDYLDSNENIDEDYMKSHMKIQQTFRYLFQETINLTDSVFSNIDIDKETHKIIHEFKYQVDLNANHIAKLQKNKKNNLN